MSETKNTMQPSQQKRKITVTPAAIEKIKTIMRQQLPQPTALRFGVSGGGCSGLQYRMEFTDLMTPMDKEFNFDGLSVYVDATSQMYLDGCTVDYVETLEQSGFKFINPNVKTTCGCGQSFAV